MSNLIPIEVIKERIFFIRGERVMIDRDLAELYGVETKQLKRQVRRNIDRFPEDFMFELTKEEYDVLRRQFGTLKRGRHAKYPPLAFTEQGVAMLSSVLNSNRAIHSDMEKGFIRAEVVSCDDLMACGSHFAAQKAGKVRRLEGKNYLVQDGDIVDIRFNV